MINFVKTKLFEWGVTSKVEGLKGDEKGTVEKCDKFLKIYREVLGGKRIIIKGNHEWEIKNSVPVKVGKKITSGVKGVLLAGIGVVVLVVKQINLLS